VLLLYTLNVRQWHYQIKDKPKFKKSRFNLTDEADQKNQQRVNVTSEKQKKELYL